MIPPPDPPHAPAATPFLRGVKAAWRSVFAYVVLGNYVGIGALAHDFGFSLPWMVLSTALIWAAPAQVILISTLPTASLIEVAIAVGLSSIRFMPMVVAVLPMLKTPETRLRHLILPAHLTAISVRRAKLVVACARRAIGRAIDEGFKFEHRRLGVL